MYASGAARRRWYAAVDNVPMRSIWKGSLAFGLVNVPIKVYSATEDHDIRFHQVHRSDGGRIKYQRVCEADGKEVAFADIVKAYENDDGRTMVLTDEDSDQLPVNSGHEIEVLTFVPAEQIDPVLLDRNYFLEPDGKSPKAYVLLRQVLKKTDRVAVVHFALRQKTRLARLRVRDEVLVVQTLLWPDEVRKAEFPSLNSKVEVKGPELKMAINLVDSPDPIVHQHSNEATQEQERTGGMTQILAELRTLGDPDAASAQIETVTTEADQRIAEASARTAKAEQHRRAAEQQQAEARCRRAGSHRAAGCAHRAAGRTPRRVHRGRS